MPDERLEYQIYPDARKYRGRARRYWIETWTYDLTPLGGIDYQQAKNYILDWTQQDGQTLLDFLVERIGGFSILGVGTPKLRFRWTAHLSGHAIDDAGAERLLSNIADRIFFAGYVNTTVSSLIVEWTERSFPAGGSTGTAEPDIMNNLILLASAGILIYVMSTKPKETSTRKPEAMLI